MNAKKKAAVFLDRDGTLNFDPGYLSQARQFRFLPKVRHALRMLSENGLELFVISNQSGIGRGLITREQLDEIHQKMTRELKKSGVALRGIFVCPHSPLDACQCRKPSPKLVLKAVRAHRIDLWNSYFVGDKITDVETGMRAGLQTVLLTGGKSKANAKQAGIVEPHHIAGNLLEAAKWIVQRHKILDSACADVCERAVAV